MLETWWCSAAICPLPNRTSCTAGRSDDGQEVAEGWRICGLPLGDLLASLLGGQQSCAPCWERSFARLMGDSLASLLGRPATLSSLLGAQLRQAYGRFAGFPFWEVSEAELPAGSSATPDSRVFGWPPFRRSASLGLPLKGAQLHHIFSTLPITFPSHAKPLGRVVCES